MADNSSTWAPPTVGDLNLAFTAVARHLHARLGERYEPPALLVAEIGCGELGPRRVGLP